MAARVEETATDESAERLRNGPIPTRLLPDTATVGPDGGLMVGGVAVDELVAEYGTPLFVYDEAHLRARCREARAVFGDNVAYAAKAFLCVAMAQLAHEEGMQLDVATGGELHAALIAGVPASRLVFHGNNKSDEELAAGLRAGVGRIVVDSFDEIDRLERLVDGLGVTPPAVLARVTPGVKAETHEFISTGQDDSKFGFGVTSGAAGAALDRLGRSRRVDLRGIHSHIGSQVFEVEAFAKAIAVVAEFAHRYDIAEVSFGGGLGVPYVESETAPSITEWGTMLAAVAADCGVSAAIGAEPGRAIAAGAAVTVYTVGTIKDIPGVRTYVAVDGGFGDNPRPVLYGSDYTTFLPREVGAPRPARARVVGKHCESGDVLVRDAPLPADLAVGDLLATPVTGAYGRGMGSNYNFVTRPAVVFTAGGDARLVVRRETYDDLMNVDTAVPGAVR